MPPPPNRARGQRVPSRGLGRENPFRGLPCGLARPLAARQPRGPENVSVATLARGCNALAFLGVVFGVGVVFLVFVVCIHIYGMYVYAYIWGFAFIWPGALPCIHRSGGLSDTRQGVGVTVSRRLCCPIQRRPCPPPPTHKHTNINTHTHAHPHTHTHAHTLTHTHAHTNVLHTGAGRFLWSRYCARNATEAPRGFSGD